MAHKHSVMRSVEAPGGQVCVDFFVRADGTWGFEEYRRDPEDPHGWRQVGCFQETVYPDLDTAERAASDSIRWLSTIR